MKNRVSLYQELLKPEEEGKRGKQEVESFLDQKKTALGDAKRTQQKILSKKEMDLLSSISKEVKNFLENDQKMATLKEKVKEKFDLSPEQLDSIIWDVLNGRVADDAAREKGENTQEEIKRIEEALNELKKISARLHNNTKQINGQKVFTYKRDKNFQKFIDDVERMGLIIEKSGDEKELIRQLEKALKEKLSLDVENNIKGFVGEYIATQAIGEAIIDTEMKAITKETGSSFDVNESIFGDVSKYSQEFRNVLFGKKNDKDNYPGFDKLKAKARTTLDKADVEIVMDLSLSDGSPFRSKVVGASVKNYDLGSDSEKSSRPIHLQDVILLHTLAAVPAFGAYWIKKNYLGALSPGRDDKADEYVDNLTIYSAFSAGNLLKKGAGAADVFVVMDLKHKRCYTVSMIDLLEQSYSSLEKTGDRDLTPFSIKKRAKEIRAASALNADAFSEGVSNQNEKESLLKRFQILDSLANQKMAVTVKMQLQQDNKIFS